MEVMIALGPGPRMLSSLALVGAAFQGLGLVLG